ncbi:hypothetical protein N7492_003238 [Penicillium capsulatum]|uniref:Uncharacterized protein n=1 Tax=Penicillium capsulatum TaxID=69766 RepID=A0A9W9IJ37_9EURO|nr:hypothetical protein N7492_003238 [Penicillium capsulatum]KAJ6122175.1 hypothetical protein N7512_004640 [Penicillium capsulatum]
MVHIVKQIHDNTVNLEQWDRIPFPSPLGSYLNFVYTIDQDAGTFTLSKRSTVNGVLMPLALEATLAEICEISSISVETLRQRSRSPAPDIEKDSESQFDPMNLKPWNHRPDLPTAMLELQQQFFLDFVFLWRSWIDDPITWNHESPVFKAFSRAILRLASWDFEVSYDCDVELPIDHSSIPSWNFPESEQYWFHGCLILLQSDLQSPQLLRTAIAKAKAFVDGSNRTPHKVSSIIISPHHVAFVELSQDSVMCSEVLPLLADLSATQFPPSFRRLSRVLSSGCRKTTWANKEQSIFPLPSEVLSEIVRISEPRDAVSLA